MKVNHSYNISFKNNLTHWFQPIYNIKNNKIIGYEALLRDSSQLDFTPVKIFNEADKNGHRNLLDLTSIKNAVELFQDESNLLFLNIYPSTLLKRNFLIWWDVNIPPQISIVLEILESESIKDLEELKIVTKGLQARGVKIALDDMGSGYSSIRQWIELEPNFIKLDKYFAENLSLSPLKQKTVKSFVDLLIDTTDIIIEGIEKKEDLEVAELLGIPNAQGFFLGRPTPKENIF